MTDDGLKTLAWCIFWGLTLHGCMSMPEGLTINAPARPEEVD